MPAFSMQGGEITTIDIWAGDVVKVKENGRRFKVTKVNPVKYKMMDENGVDGYTIPHRGVVKDEDQTWNGPKQKTEYEKVMEAIDAGITLGTAVKLTPTNLADKYPGTYVVIAMPSDGTLRLAKLGGNGGQYLRKITADQLEVVVVDA